MKPCLSEKSRDRSFGAPFLLLVWDRKTDPAPLRCARITRPMAQNLKRNYGVMRLDTPRNTPRSRVGRAFQLAHLNLTTLLEVRIYHLPDSRKYRAHFTRGKRKRIIVNFFRRIHLERGRSTRIIRASEIPYKYLWSRYQTEEGESGCRL